jgi:hypothetical protein
MHRRALLKTIGAGSCLGMIAGCISSGSSDEEPSSTDTSPDSPATTEAPTDTDVLPSPGQQHSPVTATTGAGTPGGVGYELWLSGGEDIETYRVTVVVSGPTESEQASTVFEESFTVTANFSAQRDFSFPETGTYDVQIETDAGTNTTHQFEISNQNPRKAVVVEIEEGGAFQVATYHP